MNITIKNVKHSEFASQETNCFEATVYLNGIKSFIASNDGQGGCSRYESVKDRSYQDIEEAKAWVSSLPAVETEFGTFDDDLDFYISRLVEREISKRQLKAIMRKNVVYYDVKEDELMKAIRIAGISAKSILKGQCKIPKAIAAGKLFLTDMDFDIATNLFMASTSPQKMAAIVELQLA
jgi:hypothetical protein